MSQYQRRPAENTSYWHSWTRANPQNQTGVDSIYSGPDVVQNQYQDLLKLYLECKYTAKTSCDNLPS